MQKTLTPPGFAYMSPPASPRWWALALVALLGACGGGGGGSDSAASDGSGGGSPTPGPVASTTSADCAPTSYMTGGTTWVLNYKTVRGAAESVQGIDAQVYSPRSFHGVDGLVQINQIFTAGGVRVPSGVSSYQKLVDGKIMEYGSQSGTPLALVSRAYDTPLDQAQWRLTSDANTYSYRAPYTDYNSATRVTTTGVQSGTWTYHGRVARTVPAGTFPTCHLTLTTDGGTTEYWFLVGRGVMIASTTTGAGAGTQELLNGSFNGVPLTGG